MQILQTTSSTPRWCVVARIPGDASGAHCVDLLHETARMVADLGDVAVHDVVFSSVDDLAHAALLATVYYTRPD